MHRPFHISLSIQVTGQIKSKIVVDWWTKNNHGVLFWNIKFTLSIRVSEFDSQYCNGNGVFSCGDIAYVDTSCSCDCRNGYTGSSCEIPPSKTLQNSFLNW